MWFSGARLLWANVPSLLQLGTIQLSAVRGCNSSVCAVSTGIQTQPGRPWAFFQDWEGIKAGEGRKCATLQSPDKHHSSSMQQQRLVAERGNVRLASPLLSSLSFHFLFGSRHLCLPFFSFSITLLLFLLFPFFFSFFFFLLTSSFLPYSPRRLDLFLCLQDYYGYNYYRLHQGRRRVCVCALSLSLSLCLSLSHTHTHTNTHTHTHT